MTIDSGRMENKGLLVLVVLLHQQEAHPETELIRIGDCINCKFVLPSVLEIISSAGS